MCDWQHGSSETTYTTGWSKSTGQCESNTPRDKSDTKMGAKPTYKTDPLSIELYRLKELLRVAVQDMSVARFVELRRQFDMVWSEVLEEL